MEAFVIMKVSRLPPWARNWTKRIQHTALDFDNFRASLTGSLVFYIYSSKLILFYSDHLEGRQTIENQLVHTGTSLYQCMHIITSPISILVHFFLQFYFHGSRSVRENLHPAKLSCYVVVYQAGYS